MPWQTRRPSHATGSGFIISHKRILTNAHIVSDSRFLQVQKNGDPRRFKARVAFQGHDCDLALLTVDDESFFDETTAVEFAHELPKLNDEVHVIGYPLGGDRLSITKGIVSRIDYSTYSHSGVDHHLVLQVDAAINPGNSGGPILFKEKVVGLAFQGIAWAENIGYAIPVPVIQHFLDDVADGTYHGYPELGTAFMATRNPAMRRDLKLPEHETGIVITYLDPFGSAKDHLRPRDVLLAIDDHSIANDGTIELDDNTILFAEMLERKQWGDAVTFRVWRAGAAITVKVPLTNPTDPFVYRNLYDQRPRYVMRGGLVFAPLNREYLRSQGGRAGHTIQQLLYYSRYAKVDGLYKGVDEFVLLTRRLAHPINTYAAPFINGIVTTINGQPVRRLEDVPLAMAQPTNGFHVIHFAGIDDTLVLKAESVDRAQNEILRDYHIASPQYLGEQP